MWVYPHRRSDGSFSESFGGQRADGAGDSGANGGVVGGLAEGRYGGWGRTAFVAVEQKRSTVKVKAQAEATVDFGLGE